MGLLSEIDTSKEILQKNISAVESERKEILQNKLKPKTW